MKGEEQALGSEAGTGLGALQNMPSLGAVPAPARAKLPV